MVQWYKPIPFFDTYISTIDIDARLGMKRNCQE